MECQQQYFDPLKTGGNSEKNEKNDPKLLPPKDTRNLIQPPPNKVLQLKSPPFQMIQHPQPQMCSLNNPSITSPSLGPSLSQISSNKTDDSDNEMSTQTAPPAAASTTNSSSQLQMPNWMTTEEGQNIFVGIMAYARGAHGDYSQSLGHGKRTIFF